MTPQRSALPGNPIPTATDANNPASLAQARACIESIGERLGSLGIPELIENLRQLDQICRCFPELTLDAPKLSEGLKSIIEKLPAIASCGYDPLCSALRWLCRLDAFRRDLATALIPLLDNPNTRELCLPALADNLTKTDCAEEDDVTALGDLLVHLLCDDDQSGIEGDRLAKAVLSVRRRVDHRPPNPDKDGLRASRLAMASRLATPRLPQRSNPNPNLAWPSGTLSFAEFLLQWPCEVVLRSGLSDRLFLEEAYRAILLRAPDAAEMQQWADLLQTGKFSRHWIIEDLLASSEFRDLERRVRVIYEDQVITAHEEPDDAQMNTVT